jgi:uncharacterized membrane-anchored protein
VFEMLAQIQHKQKHGTSNSILSNPQRLSSTTDEDVRVEDDSNNHRNKLVQSWKALDWLIMVMILDGVTCLNCC